MKHTKEKILNAAERLFAVNGFDATSLRDITTEADVNLAAVNYHFQSKDALIVAVLCRKLDEINARRVELLDEYLGLVGPGEPELEPILEAFLVPPFEMATSSDSTRRATGRLVGRMYSDPEKWMKEIFEDHLRPTASRFIQAMRLAVPGLPDTDFFWRFHFSIGAMAHTLVHVNVLQELSGGHCDASDFRVAIKQVVAYTAAGFRAAVAGKGAGGS